MALIPRARPALLLLSVALGLPAGCGATTADVAMHRGITAQRAGDRAKAQGAYERALRRTPKTPGANNNLALLALDEGRMTAAVGLLERELERNPEMWHARLNRAAVLVRLGRYDEAIKDAEPFAALDGGLPTKSAAAGARQRRARVIVGLARMGQGAPPEEVAAAIAKVAEQADPSDGMTALARRILGLGALRGGDIEQAVSHLEAAGEAADPVLLATLLVKLRRQADALALIAARLDEAQRTAPRVRLLVAHAHAASDDAEAARSELLALLDPNSDGAIPADVLSSGRRLDAALAARQGRWKDALESLDKAIAAVEQPVPDVWLDRAIALAHLGQLAEARQTVAGVLRDHPGYGRATKLEGLLAP